jgi:23S rRNA (adenine2503-C2)-methyltransferase
MMQDKVQAEIRNMTRLGLEAYFGELGLPAFRGRQVYEWLWKQHARSFDDMTNLPAPLRKQLAEFFTLNHLQVDMQQKSADGTVKVRFRLYDDNLVEGVLIPTDHRLTACISSQVGCNLGCKFCATGFMKNKRNLEPYEIYDQVAELNRICLEDFQKPLSNIVFMGMGEPLLNYGNVLTAIQMITGEDGMGMSSKRITVSTAGISKMIRKLGDDGVKFNLALSLHAPDDVKRSALMPINDSNDLNSLVDALNYFYEKTKGRITFEYILFDGINETEQDAKNLVRLCQRVPGARVNIIEYNPIREAEYNKSKEAQREKFIQYLEAQKVVAKVRRSRGKDIDAACGQLANK